MLNFKSFMEEFIDIKVKAIRAIQLIGKVFGLIKRISKIKQME